jgi:hypothetical protein
MTIVVLLELAALPLIELAKHLCTGGNDSKKEVRILVLIITMWRPKRVTGFLAQRKMGKIDILVAAAQLKLMKMFERNTGLKSENNLKELKKNLLNKTG